MSVPLARSDFPGPPGALRTHGAATLRRARPPAAALVATSALSTQCGAAIATRLIAQVGPAGALSLRLCFATAALALVVRPRPSDLRRLFSARRRRDLLVMVAFGLVIAAMNLSFYEAIARIPLGVAVTVEFAGPLTLSVVSSRRLSHVLSAVIAAASVVLLAAGSFAGAVRHLDTAGLGFAVLSGCFWAGYILASKETGKRFAGTSGLAGAMAIAALVVVPLGVVSGGVRLVHPEVLGVGLAIAILSSALPYRCELAALRRATPRAFGILLSMAPGIAALAGLVILGQHLSLVEIGALVLVVAANLGNALSGADASQQHAPMRAPRLAEQVDARRDGDRRAVAAHAGATPSRVVWACRRVPPEPPR